MFKICLILFLLVVSGLNFIICRMYAVIAHKKFLQGIGPTVNDTTVQKRAFSQTIKDYLAGLCFFNILIIGIIPSFRIRAFLYKNVFLMKIGKGTKIRGFVELIAPWNIEIGNNSMLGQECKLDGRKGLYIGNNVNISDCTAIWTEQHDINDENFACNDKGGKVTIKDRVWLGFRTIVLPKVNINEGVVLASGAIATKDCEEFSLYAGIPAKKIKDRTKNLKYNLEIYNMHGY